MHRLTLSREAFPEPAAMDVAVSHAVLRAVSAGEMSGVFRLHVPGKVVAFGRADRAAAGYRDAIRASAAHGFDAVERLAGGRAAVFHDQTLAFSWALADPEPRAGITERFRVTAHAMMRAFRSLDIDARVGELPGEYCPGAWSVNVGGIVKVMGVGQRLVRGAAHVGGVVVVDGGHRVREVLIPVYRALGLDWEPGTTGSLADSSPGLTTGVVADAIVASFSEHFDMTEGRLPHEVVGRAAALVEDHLPRVA